MSERDLERIPAGNIRVPVREFGLLWQSAEDRAREQSDRGVTDWAAGEVAATCRWLARASTEFPKGTLRPQSSPIRRISALAYEELIEAEYLSAETVAARTPPAPLVASRPGYVEAVRQTLGWAWRGWAACPDLGDLTCPTG
ncbi:hypothetical protein [Pseudonocardia sp. WMMC193]|uniref:hypothetical protein n=1 Tax=Pseudonocardia sp. WMMC193 TaxID=2911965 RepID=UPI001F3D70FA|nr:hypothetical protein [Pseudonocardia sp. WMMC193]MCF7552611.1 hypothetical protein [Pseudonocardia sp. WMMC193]